MGKRSHFRAEFSAASLKVWRIQHSWLDEVHFRDLGPSELREQWNSARSAAGPKFILTPGCSVPNDSRPEELSRLPQLLKA